MESYEPGYFEKEHRKWFQHPNLRLYGELARIIFEHDPRASVLDVGCGTGTFLKFLRSKSSDLSLTGIDLAPNESSQGIEYLQGDFEHASFEKKFDVVVSLAVIEHVPDVTAFAKRMRELCVTGGLVINLTVDESSLIYGVARTLNRAGYSVPMNRLYSRHHLNHFTASSLQRLLEAQGLSTVRVIRHNSPMAAVDIPQDTSSIGAAILLSGVWAGFKLGELTGRTMLQTVISKRMGQDS